MEFSENFILMEIIAYQGFSGGHLKALPDVMAPRPVLERRIAIRKPPRNSRSLPKHA
jgi:hypothetical protein